MEGVKVGVPSCEKDINPSSTDGYCRSHQLLPNIMVHSQQKIKPETNLAH